jgi:plastocyanin
VSPRRFVLTALSAAVLALGCAAAPAAANARWYTLRYGPIHMGGFNVRLPKSFVRAPNATGWITRMNARLVNRRGRPMPLSEVMLHHVVFFNHGRVGEHRPGSCEGRTGEPFYGTGEEHQQLRLPRGYGYRIRAGDRWRMQAMLMSHSIRRHDVYVQYRFKVVTRRMRPVKPYWIRANGCQSEDPSYPIYGTGRPGSTSTRSFTWKVPQTGRLVAAGGHLHGGSINMWLSQPRCGGRQLFDTAPIYGAPDNIVYNIRPILHEPGPIHTRYFESAQGIPVVKGEKLVLTSVYDGEFARPRVMSVMHLYIAPARKVNRGCSPLPADAREIPAQPQQFDRPPHVVVPLSALGPDGTTHVIAHPAGGVRVVTGNDVNVDISGFAFRPANLSIPVGAKLTWRFRDRAAHNVLLANGPHVVGSPTERRGAVHTVHFKVPGTYQFFCYLHPVTMHEEIVVRPP